MGRGDAQHYAFTYALLFGEYIRVRHCLKTQITVSSMDVVRGGPMSHPTLALNSHLISYISLAGGEFLKSHIRVLDVVIGRRESLVTRACHVSMGTLVH